MLVPVWKGAMLSMDNKLFLFPIFVVSIPIWDDSSCPWNIHEIDKGVSPDSTKHCNDVCFPASRDSSPSPNENGTILGGTVN